MTASHSDKYVITPDKFYLDERKRLMFKYISEYGGEFNCHHNLLLNGRPALNMLADTIGIRTRRKSKKKLLAELNDKIDFQIPDNLSAYKHESILDKYRGFQQINIPLSKQRIRDSSFCYDLTNLTYGEIMSGKYEMNGNVAKVWFSYPFNNKTSKRVMALLCDEIKIMSKGDTAKYAKTELIELLNNKIVLEE